MATYLIGDLHGCYTSFKKLLDTINFNPSQDNLWLTGDLVNRGENSLATLRYVYQNRHAIQTVLGNHDLHLLSTYYQKIAPGSKNTFIDAILAPDSSRLLNWLKNQPLCHLFQDANLFLSHAGLYPKWSTKTAIELGAEFTEQLQNTTQLSQFFSTLFGNTPLTWSNELIGPDRLRFIVNAMTRMRFLDHELKLDMVHKANVSEVPSYLYAWFNHPCRLGGTSDIAFGHWSDLKGVILEHANSPHHIYALDTGCVWGDELTAMELHSKTTTSVKSET